MIIFLPYGGMERLIQNALNLQTYNLDLMGFKKARRKLTARFDMDVSNNYFDCGEETSGIQND